MQERIGDVHKEVQKVSGDVKAQSQKTHSYFFQKFSKFTKYFNKLIGELLNILRSSNGEIF